MTTSRPKKRGLWIDTILICSVLALSAVLLFFFLVPKNDKESSVTNGVALAAPPEHQTKDSKYTGIKIASIISEDHRMPYSIEYPQTEDKEFNKVMKDAVYKTRDTYLASMEEVLQNDANKVGKLTITFKTLYHKKNYYSFVLTQNTYKGTGSKEKTIQTFMYDKKNKKQLFLNNVIKNENNLSKLIPFVEKQIKSDDQFKTYINTTKLKNAIAPTYSNYKHFSLTDSSLYIYFDGAKLSDNSNAISKIKIPLSSVNSILAKPFKIAGINPDGTRKKQIALTFDDGPNAKVTPKILKTLKKYNAKATFFMLGSQAMYNQKLAKKVASAGHEIGNHSFSHTNLVTLSNKKIKAEINRTNEEIKRATGEKPTLFRPPYGSINERVRSQNKLPVILWDVDTLDWKHRNPKTLLTMVKQYSHDGAIILMHDIQPTTAQGLDSVLAYLQKQGYEFVTISELRR